MTTVYSEYCGHKFPNARMLVTSSCSRHPNGSNKGKHKLDEGAKKSKYTCRHCGKNFLFILIMVGTTCPYHPNGSNKGGILLHCNVFAYFGYSNFSLKKPRNN